MTTSKFSMLLKLDGNQNESTSDPKESVVRPRGKTSVARLAAVLAFLMICSSIFTAVSHSKTSTSSRARAILPNSTPLSSSQNTAGGARRSGGTDEDNYLLPGLVPRMGLTGSRPLELFLSQAPPASESIATFEEDCTTPKTDFNFGETVCAIVSNATLGANERLVWGHTDGFLAREVDITSINQSDQLLLTPTSVLGGVSVNNRGTWRILSIDVDGAPVAVAYFTIHDPETPTADLSVYKFTQQGDSKVNEGSDVSFVISVANQGPDAAQNVHLADLVPDVTTFISLTQNSGPAFTCLDSNCTISTLAKGAIANFTAIYHTNGIASGTLTTYSATVSSDTAELHPADNTTSGELSIVVTSTTATCTLECPDNINATANTTEGGQRGAHLSYDAGAPTGDCGAVTATPASGSFFPVGTTTVTVNSQTGGGSCGFTVTVEDSGTNPATISCPVNQDVTSNNNCEGSVTVGNPNTTGDNVTVIGNRSDGKPMYDCDLNGGNCTRRASDDPFSAGITTVTWSAYSHDIAGPYATAEDEESHRTGSVSCSQTITVNDVTPPTINAPSDQTASADATCQVAVPDFSTSATVSDNCGCSSSDVSESCADRQPITITQSPAPGTLVALGPHTITLTANDGSSNNNGAGNTATAQFTFRVNDTTAPVVTAPANSSASADASCQAAVPNYISGSTASDNCDGNPTVTQSPAAGTLVGVGPHTVTVNATDSSGNHSSDVVVFTVNDNTAPVISCPSNIVVYLPLNSSATSMTVSYPAVTATDNCSASSITTSRASGSAFPVGTTTVSATATDVAGNSSTCSFSVTVRYDFTGFFSPVISPPTLNAVNGGRAIPVKFSLSGDKGLNVFAANNPYSTSLNCNTNDPGVDVTETLTAGASSLIFSGDQYNYVWKTESSWVGTCRQLVLTLSDGSVHTANFKFK